MRPLLHHSLTRRSLHTDHLCVNGLGQNVMLAASLTIDTMPDAMMMSIEWRREQATRALA